MDKSEQEQMIVSEEEEEKEETFSIPSKIYDCTKYFLQNNGHKFIAQLVELKTVSDKKIIKIIEYFKLNYKDETNIPDQYYGCDDSLLMALIDNHRLHLLEMYIKEYGLNNTDVLHFIDFTEVQYLDSLELIIKLGYNPVFLIGYSTRARLAKIAMNNPEHFNKIFDSFRWAISLMRYFDELSEKDNIFEKLTQEMIQPNSPYSNIRYKIILGYCITCSLDIDLHNPAKYEPEKKEEIILIRESMLKMYRTNPYINKFCDQFIEYQTRFPEMKMQDQDVANQISSDWMNRIEIILKKILIESLQDKK